LKILVYNLQKMEVTNKKEKVEEIKNRNGGIHPDLYKAFIIVSLISFSLGSIVNLYTLKKLNS